METIKQKRSRAGRLGFEARHRTYRLLLLDQLIRCKSVDTRRYNFYKNYAKYDYSGRLLREAVEIHKKIDKEL